MAVLLWQPPTRAQAQAVVDDYASGQASGTLYSAVVPLAFPRSYLFAQGDFGERPGVIGDFVNLGAFFPMQFHGPDEVFFLEGQVWVGEQRGRSLVGGTFGLGNRWLIGDYSQMIGVNAFAAWDQTRNRNNYDGAGVGVEWLTDYLGVTANAYIPWNSRRINEIGPATADKDTAFFTGPNLAFTTFQPVEEQLLGGDIEVGSAIPRAEWLSVYAGAYHFDAAQGNDFTGVSGRVQMDFTNAILNLTVSDDRRFGTTVNFQAEMRVGDGRISMAPRYRTLNDQMFDRVRRRSRISTLEYIQTGQDLAINPATGLPFEFLHVDNTAAPGGTGTFESRFDQLDLASNMPQADFILVYRGDTEYGGPHLQANNGLILTENQIVIGQGYEYLLESAQFPGMLCPLPGFGDGGTNPFIAGNNGANLITLSDNNQILGLNLISPDGGNAIVGNGIENVVIDEINRDINFSGGENSGLGGGIILTNSFGNATITNIGFDIQDPTALGGIVINNTNTDDLNLTINNDLGRFPELVVMGGQVGIGITANNSDVIADIDNILASMNGTGLNLAASNGGDIQATVNDSTFNDATNNGIQITGTTGGNVDLTANNTDATNAGGSGLAVNMNNATGTAVLMNGSLDDAGDDAVQILLSNAAEFGLALGNVTGDNADQNGLHVNAQSGAQFEGMIVNSSFTNTTNGSGVLLDFDGPGTTGTLAVQTLALDQAGANALQIETSNQANVTMTGTGVSGSQAGQDGINLNAIGNSEITVALTNLGSFAEATEDGIDITNVGSQVQLSLSGAGGAPVDFSNFVNGNGLLSNSTGAGANTTILFPTGANFDNVLMNAAIDAINITSNDGAVTTLGGTAISGANAGNDGIQLSSDNGTIIANITAAGSFANAGQSGAGNGINVLNENGGQIQLTMAGAGGAPVDFSNAADNGLLSNSTGADTTTIFSFPTGANFNEAGNNAIDITSTGGAGTQITGTNMSGNLAGNNAINLLASDPDSIINLNFTGTNDFTDANNNGIFAQNSNGGLINVNIADANFSSTMPGTTLNGDGLFSFATGADTITNFAFGSGAAFDNAQGYGIAILSDSGAVTNFIGDGVSGELAGIDGILLDSISGTINMNLTNTGSFAGAGQGGNGDGIRIIGLANAEINLGVAGVNGTPADFTGAADNGLNISLDDSTATIVLNEVDFSDPLGNNAILGNAQNGSTLTITGQNVAGANAANNAIELIGDDSIVNLTLGSTGTNDFSNAANNGLVVTGTNGSTFNINVANTNFDGDNMGTLAGSGFLGNLTDSTAVLNLNNVTANFAGQDGFSLTANNSIVTGGLTDTQFNNAGNDAFLIDALAAASVTLNINNLSGIEAGNNGLNVRAVDLDTEVNLTIIDADFSMAGNNGLNFFLDNDAEVTVASMGLIADDATVDAVNIFADNNSILDLTIQNGSLLNAGDDTFDITFLNGAAVTVLVNPTPATGAGDNGLEFNGASGGVLNFTMLDSPLSTIADPVGNNGVIGLLDNATANLTFTNSDINTDGSSTGDGINVTGTNESAFTLNLNNSNVIGWSNGSGITIDMDDSTAMLFLNGADVSGAGVNALGITASNGSVVSANLGTGANLDDAGNSAIFVNASGMGTQVGIQGVNATGNEAGANAIDISTDDGALAMLQLTGGGSFEGAGGNAVNLNATNGSGINVELSGTIGSTFSLDGSGGFGLNGSATSGSSLQVVLDRFSASNNVIGGINLSASGMGSQILGTQITNGTIQDNGVAGLDDSFGIQFSLDDNATAGNRLTQTATIRVEDVIIGNSDPTAMTQDLGIILNVDNDAYLGAIFDGVFTNFNEFGGLQANVNSSTTPLDSALLVFTYSNGTISNNGGDGVFLQALNSGDNPDPMNQTAGIIAGFTNTDIVGNSNFFAQPVDPNDVPDPGADMDFIGYGLSALADNNIITVNFDNVNLGDNEEGATLATAINGGVINFNFANMTIFDPVEVCAMGPGSFASVTLDNVTIDFNNAAIDNAAISMVASDGGHAVGNFTDVTILNVQAQAFAFLSEDPGSLLEANFTNLMIDNVGHGAGLVDPKTGLALHALIQGEVRNGAQADINMEGVSITDSDLGSVTNVNAVDIDVFSSGELNLTIEDFTIVGNVTNAIAGEGEIDITVNGMNSVANLDLSDITINNSTGIGLNIETDVDGLVNFTAPLTGIQAQGAAEEGLRIVGNLGSDLTITDSSFNGAGADGIHLDLNVTSDTTLTMTSVFANDAGGSGISIDLNAAGAGIQTINLDNLTAQNAMGGDGLNINVSGLLAGDEIDITLTGTNGINNFSGASGDGINILLDGALGSSGSVHVEDVLANGVGGIGVDVNVTGGITVDMGSSFNNITAMNAGQHGLNITSDAASTITAIRGTGNNFNGAGQSGPGFNGMNIEIGAQTSDIEIDFSSTTANNASGTGVNIILDGVNAESTINLTGITATGAQAGNGLNITALNALATDIYNIDVTGSNFSNAAQNGININLPTGQANINLDNTQANAAGLSGVNIILPNLQDGSGVTINQVTANGSQNGDGLHLLANLAAGAEVDVTVGGGSSFSNSVGGHGANLDINGDGSNVINLSINGLTANNNTNNGLNLQITNGETVNFDDFANVTTNLNMLSGVNFEFLNGSTINFDPAGTFENIQSTGNQQHGMNVEVASGSVVTPVEIDGLNLSGNGVAGVGFNGLNMFVHGTGSSAAFTFNNLTINNTGGRAIDLDVYDDAELTFNINGANISNSGLEGIDVNVGSRDQFGSPLVISTPGTFTGTFTDVNVSTSGQSLVFQANGIDVNVGGAGSSANLTLDNTSSNNNDGNGIDILVNTGADAVIAVNNGTEASGNATRGFRLRADAATLDFTSASGPEGDNVFNNNLGGAGFEVVLTNGTMVDNLEINASASGNAGDGIRIIANDGSGVSINNFDISGDDLNVNGNTGNGLFVDFNNVGGISNISLENATVSGNSLNQIYYRLNDMTLGNFILRDVTATGTGTSLDGIRVDLIDTFITNVSTPGDLQGFVVDGVVATNNGGRGLNLLATESVRVEPADGADSGIAGGIITNSQFSGNGQAGAALTFQGEGVYDFNIFDNTGGTLGFNNNTGRGLLIQVQDHTTFIMAGNNPSDPDPATGSFYNNSISGNGGIGMHVVANEPITIVPAVPGTDMTGPRVELELGDILRNPNILTGNTDAAMAIELLHDATGSFSIVNSVHQNTVNGPNVNFNGDGLAFRLANFASLDSLTIDGTAAGVTLNNNAGSGLVTSVSQNARLGTIENLTVLNTTITGNGLHGIDIRRSGAGLYGANAASDMIFIGEDSMGNRAGNTFSNNGQAGINILSTNQPGMPSPLDLLIAGNDFIGNFDGIRLIGQANAQFAGNFSDNVFTNQTRDGIQVILENDAALGDPVAGSDPFVMDGNQIIGSGRHGIFFDTNFTNDTLPTGGNAFANVLIRDSLLDGTRTLISGSGRLQQGDGIRIIDNSALASGGAAVNKNTYTVFATDIRDSSRDGIQFNMASQGGAVGTNTGHRLMVGDITNAGLGRRDVTIHGSGRDGINVDNNGNAGRAELIVSRTEIGTDGDGNGRDGVNVLVRGTSRLDTTMEFVDVIFNERHGMQFNVTTTASNLPVVGGDITRTTMNAVNSSNNAERGLDIILRHDRNSATSNVATSQSIWNIGTPDRIAMLDQNQFNDNGREGIVIDLQATALDTRTINAVPASGIQTNSNNDMFILMNQAFGGGTPQTRLSTTHPGLAAIATSTIGTSRVRLTATTNIINNEISNNGGFAGFEDGLNIGIGNNTRFNGTIAGNVFSGNVDQDIRIYAQRSGEFNPGNSVNNNPAAQINGMNQNYFVYDPVAYADLVFGMIDTNNDNIPDFVLGNTGEQIIIHTDGIAGTNIITNGGQFTNSDPIKGGTRPVFLAGFIQAPYVVNTDNILLRDFDTTVNNFELIAGSPQALGTWLFDPINDVTVGNGAFTLWRTNSNLQTWPSNNEPGE